MRLAIVEGEPGIFPDPVARLLGGLGRLVRRRRAADPAPPVEPPAPGPAAGAERPDQGQDQGQGQAPTGA